MNRNRKALGLAALAAAWLSAPALATARADDEVQAVAIAEKMSVVVDDLGQKKTGEPVQKEQKGIVNDLDALIASLEKECKNCRNGVKRNNPTRGMADSTISAGTGGIGTLTNPNESGKDWGALTARERDRILQSQTEGFPPEYRTVLERYYRRLADEKSAKAAAAPKDKDKEPAPATKP